MKKTMLFLSVSFSMASFSFATATAVSTRTVRGLVSTSVLQKDTTLYVQTANINGNLVVMGSITAPVLITTGSVVETSLTVSTLTVTSSATLMGFMRVAGSTLSLNSPVLIGTIVNNQISQTGPNGYIVVAGTVGYRINNSSDTQTLINIKNESTTNNSTTTFTAPVTVSSITSTGPLSFTGSVASSGTLVMGQGDGVKPLWTSAGLVHQTVQATVTAATTTVQSTFTISSLSATITPKFATSKIKISFTADVTQANTATSATFISIFRGTTNLAGTNGFTGINLGAGVGSYDIPGSITYLDSPATTSATVYSIVMRSSGGAAAGFGGTNLTSVLLLEEIGQAQ